MDTRDDLDANGHVPSHGLGNGNGAGNGNDFAVAHAEKPMGELTGAVTTARSELIENLHSAKGHLGTVEIRQHEILDGLVAASERWEQKVEHEFQGLAQQVHGLQQQVQALQLQLSTQQLPNLQQQLQDLQSQLQTFRQEATEVQGGLRAWSDKVETLDNRCGGNDRRLDEIATALDEEGKRRTNVEMAISEIDQKLAKIGSSDMSALRDQVDVLRATIAAGRGRQMLAMAASLIAVLFAGYVFAGKPGWQFVMAYVEPLLPPWSI